MRHWIHWLKGNCEELLATAALLALALFMLANAFPVLAAPQVRSSAQCDLFTDMALVARALAEEQATDKLAYGVLYRVYNLEDRTERVEMAGLLMAQARNSELAAGEYAAMFSLICKHNRGNVDAFFKDGA